MTAKETSDPAADRRAELNRRLRAAFVEGAEEDSRRRLRRGLAANELAKVPRDPGVDGGTG